MSYANAYDLPGYVAHWHQGVVGALRHFIKERSQKTLDAFPLNFRREVIRFISSATSVK